jgi:ABC-type multidrug transport system ATPase subunit
MKHYGKLRLFVGNTLVHETTIHQETLSLGRSSDNDVILNNPHISRYQARMHYENGAWVLENISKNVAIHIQNQPITGPTRLQPGEPFECGEMRVVLELEPPAPSEVAPSSPSKDYRTVVLHEEPDHSTMLATPTVPTESPPDAPPRTVMVSAGARLKVTYQTIEHGEVTQEYPLTKGYITLGRAQDNDIMIPVSTVSRLHASLRLDDQGYTIIDEASTNGILYKGALTSAQRLVDSDVMRIDDELGNFVTLTYLDPARPAPSQVKDIQLAGAQREITIGRTADNTIVLDHPQVSARHAIIRRTPEGVLVEDRGSTNGTYVNHRRITRATLHPGDQLQIASYQLVYQDDELVQTDAEQIRVDALALHKAVNKGSLVLLHQISLSIQPRELVAIVGGSGAGKSTLMNALSGFRPAPEGTVLLNGDDYYQNLAAYRSTLGYVPQDDIIHRELTVEQTLRYAARLRLPRDLSAAEIEQRIATVLEDIEMSAFRTSTISQLSGGQRKRISIAVELLAKPRIFYLDEPLTGLDPGISKRMVSLLRRLADRGQTIMFITHATASVLICDKLIVLGRGGRLCFFGPPQKAMDFFEAQEFADIYAKLEQTPESSRQWAERFKESPYYQEYVAKRAAEVAALHTPASQHIGTDSTVALAATPAQNPQQASTTPSSQPDGTARKTSGGRSQKASIVQQLVLLTRRYATIMRHDHVNLLLSLLSAPIIGLVIALVANANIFMDGTPPLDAQRVVFLLAIASVFLGANSASQEIAREAPVYMRERLVSLRVVPYILSKFIVLACMALAQTVLLVSFVLMGTGLPPGGTFLPATLELFIGVWLSMLSGVAMGLLISSWAPNTDVAISIVPILLVFQIMLAGLIFPLHGCIRLSESPHIEACLDIVSYPIVAKWSTDSLGTTVGLNRLFYQDMAAAPPDIRPLTLPSILTSFDTANYGGVAAYGSSEAYSLQSHLQSRRVHLLGRWGILAGLTIFFLFLAILSQQRKDRLWQVK